MSSSGCQWMSLRPFILIFLVVSCAAFLSWTYYKPDIKFIDFSQYVGRLNPSCPTIVCPVINQTEHFTSNCSSNFTQQPTVIPTVLLSDPVVTEPDTIVLIWMYPFGSHFDLSCDYLNIKKCQLTDDKSMYSKAHGVLFHHRDINPASLPNEPRPWFQKWVWFNMESPANTHSISQINHSFNLTCSYRLDSSIPVPYGHLVPVTPEEKSFTLPQKNKLVCWIVSNWNPNFRRVKFYNELKEHVKIETYGNAFGKRVSNYENIVSSCKFYLSFENSVYKDYMTEKLFRPMTLGTVPVVLGPPRQNYQNNVPADSFIHVDDFSSPKELADRLLYLDQHDSEYMKYFEWRKTFKAENSQFGRSHACETCRYLQSQKQYQEFNELNEWFWG